MGYLPTKATIISKRIITIVSSPGIFREGGKEIGKEYELTFKSKSGKIWSDSDFGYSVFSQVQVGDEVFLRGNIIRFN